MRFLSALCAFMLSRVNQVCSLKYPWEEKKQLLSITRIFADETCTENCVFHISLKGSRFAAASKDGAFLFVSDDAINDKRDKDSYYLSVHDSLKAAWRIIPANGQDDTFYMQLVTRRRRRALTCM